MWLSLRLLEQQGQQEQEQPLLLLLDDHAVSPLDLGWQQLFGGACSAGRILRVSLQFAAVARSASLCARGRRVICGRKAHRAA